MMKYPESESSTLELKREPPKNRQIVKTVVGFCNTYGGRLILGVADNRDVIGLDDALIDEIMEHVDKTIADSCSPQIMPRVYTQRFEDKSVLIIEVSEGMSKPYFRCSEGLKNGVFIRL